MSHRYQQSWKNNWRTELQRMRAKVHFEAVREILWPDRSFAVLSAVSPFSSPELDMDSFSICPSKMSKRCRIYTQERLWVAHFLSLLQRPLQSCFLGRCCYETPQSFEQNTVGRKKKPTCYEQDTGHTSSKYLPSIICSWRPLSFILQSQR